MVRADERLKRELSRITLPVLIMHGTQDYAALKFVVSCEGGNYIGKQDDRSRPRPVRQQALLGSVR